MGGTETTTTPLSDDQNAIIRAGLPSAQAGGTLSANLLGQLNNTFTNGTTGAVTPNYSSMQANADNSYTTMNQSASNLANGVVNQTLLDNMNNATKNNYNATMGTTIANGGKRGVMNSSGTNKAIANAQTAFDNASAQNYQGALNTQSNMLNNQSSLLGNQVSQANNLATGSYLNTDKMYGYGTGNAYTTSANNATSTANSQQTTTTQDQGFLGGLMSGVGSFYGSKSK